LRANGSARTRGPMTGSAKQSIAPQGEEWIASSLSLLAMTGEPTSEDGVNLWLWVPAFQAV